MSTTDQTTSPEPRVTVDHSGDGTTATFDKDDLDARAAAKAAGFKWSRNLGAWFLPRTWTHPTRTLRVRQLTASLPGGAVAVESTGPEVTTTAAEREAVARQRAAERAEYMDAKAEKLAAASNAAYTRQQSIGDRIPMGQPVLLGHHSQRRHERDIATMGRLMTASVQLDREADAAARSAEVARRAADGTPAITRLRRIERKSAELRDVERRIAKSSNAEYIERMEIMRATLVDEIEHDRKMVEESGRKVYTKADVAKGDVVIVRGRPRKVVRVNTKSVSVETGYSWTDTVPYYEIQGVQ